MVRKYNEEFKRDAVCMALASGLTRLRLASGLGVGVSTLNKRIQKHQHDNLMFEPHKDVKENAGFRKEARLLMRAIAVHHSQMPGLLARRL